MVVVSKFADVLNHVLMENLPKVSVVVEVEMSQTPLKPVQLYDVHAGHTFVHVIRGKLQIVTKYVNNKYATKQNFQI